MNLRLLRPRQLHVSLYAINTLKFYNMQRLTSIIYLFLTSLLIIVSCQNKSTVKSQTIKLNGYGVGDTFDSAFVEIDDNKNPSRLKDNRLALFHHVSDSTFICQAIRSTKTILYIRWNEIDEENAGRLISNLNRQLGIKAELTVDEANDVVTAYTWRDLTGNELSVFKRWFFSLKDSNHTVNNLEYIENFYYNEDSTAGYYWRAECLNHKFRNEFNKVNTKN